MMKRETVKEVGIWIICLFLALICLRSGITKLPETSFWIRDFNRWHYPGWFRITVGIIEIAAGVLLLWPRMASAGASLFAIVMLGAIYTHASHNEMARLPFNFLLGCLSMFVIYARQRLFRANFAASIS
jgi:putative oxidoreductase